MLYLSLLDMSALGYMVFKYELSQKHRSSFTLIVRSDKGTREKSRWNFHSANYERSNVGAVLYAELLVKYELCQRIKSIFGLSTIMLV